MKLLSVPATRGFAWLRQGFRIFTQQPLAFSVLFAAFLFAGFVLLIVPAIGPLLVLAMLPLGTLGFMVATRQALGGAIVTPRAFVEPLRRGRAQSLAMLRLGLAYAVASALTVVVSGWADGGALEAAMDLLADGGAEPAQIAERFSDPRVELGLALRLGFAALLSIPFWHAPALVHWGGQGVAQALFSSTVAVWRNRGAFAIFGLAWVGLVIGFGIVASVVFALLGAPRVAALALMPATLLFSTAFYASLWFTYADCFGSGADDESTLHPITTDTP